MHLLTGLMLGELLMGSRMLGKRAPEVPFEIVHSLPGRLRVRVAALRGQQASAREVVALLTATPGVNSASANALTGTMLIHFDDGPEIRAALVEALEGAAASLTTAKAEAAHETSLEAGAPPKILHRVGGFARHANTEVLEHSGGLVDLETLLGAACALWGAKTLLSPGLLARWQGVTLLYWSYNIFRRRLSGGD